MHARLLHGKNPPQTRLCRSRDYRQRASVAVTVNIAFRLWSGDLILMNAGLAKPIPHYLVYSKAVIEAA